MLRKHKRLTKKELKQDPLVLFAAQAMDFLEREWLKILAVVVTVVVVVGASLLITRGRERNAINAYDAAMNAMSSDAPEADDLLRRVVDDYGGSDVAEEAVIDLANDYYQNGDYDNAATYYQRYINKYGDDAIFLLNAYNGLASSYEEQGKFSDAAGIYEEYISKHKNSGVFIPMMHMKAAKAYLSAGDTVSARDNFEQIASSFGDSPEHQEAAFYLEMLN